MSSEIKDFYEEALVDRLVRDYVDGNLRFEAAMATVRAVAPPTVRSILDLGCGIGYSSWLLHRAYPAAQVLGIDLSETHIGIGRRLFQAPGLTLRAGDVATMTTEGPFDLIVLIDVYEHIPRLDRTKLHAVLARCLAPDGRIVLTTPTPEFLAHLRRHRPSAIQIVDEDVTLGDLEALMADLGALLVSFTRHSIWQTLDYQHAVGWRRAADPIQDLPTVPTTGPRVVARLWARLLGRLGRWLRRRRVAARVRKSGPGTHHG